MNIMASATTQHNNSTLFAKLCAYVLWVLCSPIIIVIGSLKYISKFHFTPTISLLLSGFIFIFNPIAALISSAAASAWLVGDIARRNAFPRLARVSLPLAAFVTIGVFTPLLINSQYTTGDKQSDFLYQSLIPTATNAETTPTQSTAVLGVDIENLTVRYNDEFELCVTDGTDLYSGSQEAFSSIEECNRYAIAKKQSTLIRQEISAQQQLTPADSASTVNSTESNTTPTQQTPITSDINEAGSVGGDTNASTGNQNGDTVDNNSDQPTNSDPDTNPTNTNTNPNPNVNTDIGVGSGTPPEDDFILDDLIFNS